MEGVIYLLDTDALVTIIRGLKSARRLTLRQQAQSLIERSQQAQSAGDAVGLSAVTVSELEFGARQSGDYEAEIAAVRKMLTPFEIYDYDAVSCPGHYGRIRHALETIELPIGAMDLLIAAHAMALDATVVSNNVAHFLRVVGLRTVNWLKG